jgi:hypothetical protein
MSRYSDRRNAPFAWHPAQTALVLALIERNQRIAELMAEMHRRCGGREELQRQVAAFWTTALRALEPLPGQPSDSAINTGGCVISKGSDVTRFYARTHSLTRRNGHLLAAVEVNCGTLPTTTVRKAFQKAGRVSLRQMRDPDTRPAGFLLHNDVSIDGVARLVLVVTDEAACKKLATRTYTGVVVSFDVDEVADISLVDAPLDFVGEFAKRAPEVLVKVFDGDSMKFKKLSKRAAKLSRKTGYSYDAALKALQTVRPVPALPASAEAALAEKSRVDKLAASGMVDGLVAKALQRRADDAIGLEMIKAARSRPVSYGDLGMIGFLRGGRP